MRKSFFSIPNNKIYLFYAYEYFPIHMYVHHMLIGGLWIWQWSYEWLWAAMWGLATKSRSFARAISALNHWVIAPVRIIIFLLHCFIPGPRIKFGRGTINIWMNTLKYTLVFSLEGTNIEINFSKLRHLSGYILCSWGLSHVCFFFQKIIF